MWDEEDYDYSVETKYGTVYYEFVVCQLPGNCGVGVVFEFDASYPDKWPSNPSKAVVDELYSSIFNTMKKQVSKGNFSKMMFSDADVHKNYPVSLWEMGERMNLYVGTTVFNPNSDNMIRVYEYDLRN